jgi:hypothetical protein
MMKKFRVAGVYKEMMDSTAGKVSCSAVAVATKMSRTFVQKVIDEVNSGGLVDPDAVRRDHVRGRGARSLTVADEVVLLFLYNDCPSRSLKNYQERTRPRKGPTHHHQKKYL